MQREHRGLQAEPHHDEGEGGLGDPVMALLLQHGGHVGHVERAGRHVEEADADHEEGGTDRAQNQVVVAGCQRAAVLAHTHGDDGVGRDRGNLEKDKDVEGVACHRHTDQAREADEEGGIEQRLLLLGHFIGHARQGVDEAEHTQHAQQQEDRDIQAIEADLDPVRRRPAAHFVRDHTVHTDLAKQAKGQHGHDDRRCHSHAPGPHALGHEGGQRRGDQRHNHNQDRRVCRDTRRKKRGQHFHLDGTPGLD